MASPSGWTPVDRRKTYRLFGLNVSSDFPFTWPPEKEGGRIDLSFHLSSSPVVPGPWKKSTPVYSSPFRSRDGESRTRLYRLENCEALCFSGSADFYLQADSITGHLLSPALDFMLEMRFLGPVLSYWLERRGIPTLHASAVATKQGAIAFLSHKEGGKTGLAAAFLQAGVPLLTDDVLPVEETSGMFLARPGYPLMRMWPDEAEFFVPGWEALPTVHPAISKRRVPVGDGGFGAFHGESLPLACLYLPERMATGPVEIQEVSPRDAVIELVRHSFSPRLTEAAGLGPQRLDVFARLAMQVPVRRLRYPSGFARLPEAVERVLR